MSAALLCWMQSDLNEQTLNRSLRALAYLELGQPYWISERVLSVGSFSKACSQRRPARGASALSTMTRRIHNPESQVTETEPQSLLIFSEEEKSPPLIM